MLVITNNCFGVRYEKTQLREYQTPFCGMYLVAPDYIELLENFERYMSISPVASEGNATKHYKQPRKYPVLLLDGVEVHFSHEKGGAQAAIDKWNSRRKRMVMDIKQMFVKFCDRDKFSKELGDRFLKLKFPNKKLYISKRWEGVFKGDDVVLVANEKTRCPIGTKLEKMFPIKQVC